MNLEHKVKPEALHEIKDRNAQAAVAHMYRESRDARDRLAAEASRLDGVKKEQDARQRFIAREAEQALGYVNDPKLRAWMAKVAAEPEPDQDTPEYAAFAGRRAALDTVKEFFGHLSAANQTIQQQRAALDAEAARAEQRAALTAYIEPHIDDFRNPEVMARVKVLMAKGHKVEEAHRISMAERVAEGVKTTEELKRQAQEVSRSRVRRGGRSDSTTAEPPKGLDIVDRDAWYQQHPEAAKARLDRLRRRA